MSHTKPDLLEQVINFVCKTILWVTTTVIFAILVTNTFLRYSQGSSLQWANELPELLFPWLVMAGVVLASVHGSHIATTFLMAKLAPKVRQIAGVTVWLSIAAMYAALSQSTYNMLDIVADEKSPVLRVPSSVTYSCMLGGMVMLGLLALQSAWRIARGLENFPGVMGDDDAGSAAQG